MVIFILGFSTWDIGKPKTGIHRVLRVYGIISALCNQYQVSWVGQISPILLQGISWMPAFLGIRIKKGNEILIFHI